MQITEITVGAGRTFNHPYENFSNLKPFVNLKASLSRKDDPDKAVQQLQIKAEKLVEDHKKNMLRRLEDDFKITQRQIIDDTDITNDSEIPF